MSATHVVVAGSQRTSLPGAIATAPANPNAIINVTLKLRRVQSLPELTERPSSSMTHEKFAELYGAAEADVEKAVAVLSTFGLTKVNENRAARSVRFQGTVSSMEQAFQVKLFNYTHATGSYRGRVGYVHIPVELQDIVKGVFGLDNRQVARRKRTPISGNHAHLASVPSAWYLPSELATHYNFPAGDGSGQTIGLLEFGGGFFQDDFDQFCSLAQIQTPPKVTPVSVDGTPTAQQGRRRRRGDAGRRGCRGCLSEGKHRRLLRQLERTGMDHHPRRRRARHAKQSRSPVGELGQSGGQRHLDTAGDAGDQQNSSGRWRAGHHGVRCSGDDGSSDALTDGLAHVDFPSSSPYALSVGAQPFRRRAVRYLTLHGKKEPV